MLINPTCFKLGFIKLHESDVAKLELVKHNDVTGYFGLLHVGRIIVCVNLYEIAD